MYVGESVTLFLRATDPAGEQVAANSAATWTTSDAGVATVKSRGSRETAVTAMRPGVVTITATLQGRSVIQALTILSVPDAAGSLLVVESFRILEFQYPTAPGQWFYRSQMRLRVTGNNDSVVVTGMTFLIPGLGAVPPCKNVIMLSGNTPADVFTEIRSDLQFLGAQPGVRATGDEATVIVTVTDGRGVSTDIVARGEIVAVTFPQTPPGGGVSRKCF